MANYNPMKKNELIKVLKERDATIAGFEKTNRLLSEENKTFFDRISGLEKDCDGMTEECNKLRNKVNGLSDDLKKSNEICENLTKEKDALRIEKNAAKTMVDAKEDVITTLKRQRVILGIITITAILIAIIL